LLIDYSGRLVCNYTRFIMSSFLTRLKITFGSANADQHALTRLRSDGHAIVTPGKDIVFEPVGVKPDTGVIFYPGGRCDPRAYAPLMRAVAEEGFLAVIACMPMRMAVLDANRAQKVIAAYPRISRWVIGGHSMGGAMAAAFAHKHQEALSGLFFMGSYAANMHAMPESQLPVLMIHGTRDFITSKAEFEAQPERLPPHTVFVPIEGGDHYQFGSFKNGEVTASISRDAQHEQTIRALTNFLKGLPDRQNEPG
jgi:pimeloyl-ACP methyl ester carboxylesterase